MLQARTHQLLVQNRELLEHVNALVGRLQDIEMRVTGVPPEFAYRTPAQVLLQSWKEVKVKPTRAA